MKSNDRIWRWMRYRGRNYSEDPLATVRCCTWDPMSNCEHVVPRGRRPISGILGVTINRSFSLGMNKRALPRAKRLNEDSYVVFNALILVRAPPLSPSLASYRTLSNYGFKRSILFTIPDICNVENAILRGDIIVRKETASSRDALKISNLMTR